LQAHAYFLHRGESLTPESAARLQAMAELHELGSGFDVANRDLEIRGAGSLLGTEQSGLAARVGFDLYMRMLKKSVRQLRRLDLPTVTRTNMILPKGEGSIEGSNGEGYTFAIANEYIVDSEAKVRQEGAARLAENTEKLVELTEHWKDTYGPLPSELQAHLKTLHLHVCTRLLGIDLAGLVKNAETGDKDCILRAPGIRARHWARICASLPRKTGPKGLDIVFPARFNPSEEEIRLLGGTKIKWDEINQSEQSNSEDWDSYDEEQVEALKVVSSSMNLVTMDDIDIEEFPHFIIRDLGSVKYGARISAILKVLLPVAKVVTKNQAEDKERVKIASELRAKREAMKKKKKPPTIF